MPAVKQCEFFLLRYVPDVVRNEAVNLGVILMEQGGDGFTDVRLVRDWRRVRCADPDVEVELLEAYEEEFRRLLQSHSSEIINYRGPMSRREWLLALMQDSFSGALELLPMQAVETESPAAELGKLAHIYVEPPARGQRIPAGRRLIYQAMRDAFEGAGVWQFMRKDVAVKQYSNDGDPLKIDCGYRPNGVVHLFHAVSLATDVNSAKVLAFSYPKLREGIASKENVMTDLTAIVEPELDESDESIAFAIAMLQRNAIAVSTVSRLSEIAERARLELKL